VAGAAAAGGAMGGRPPTLRARQAALVHDVAALLRARGAPAAMTPGQAIAAGYLTLGELDLLAQPYGLRIEPGGRITEREGASS
jgi:hypothetical protein